MSNRDTQIVWDYHNATKHSYWSIRTNAHYLDWPNQPLPFKVYSELEPIPLPSHLPQTGISALEAISATTVEPQGEIVPDLLTLAHVLFYSAGITKKKTYAGGEIAFRAAACAGALYPIEIYVVCGELPGLEAGVYHFGPLDFALRRLRTGDYREVLIRATGNEPSVSTAPVILICTAITWRSSWKYQARSYRYHFWDCGMVLANTLAAAAAHHLPAKIVMGFADDDVNHLVGVDGQREMALALVPLGHTATAPPPAPKEITSLKLTTVPLSPEEVDYPIIREMHTASNLRDANEVVAWRRTAYEHPVSKSEARVHLLKPLEAVALSESLEAVILRRASTRTFARKPISLAQLSLILEYATGGVPTDFHPSATQFNELYLNIHSVEGLASGAYYYRRQDRASEQLKAGDFRHDSTYLCLEQPLGGESAATIFFLADFNRILDHYGNRGYRLAQMEAGIIGGKLYLAAYALARGATGLTFYDDDVTDFFSPHALGKSAIFVMSIGVPGRRPLI
jgi:SagB-type dehydrogenase family enzyme